MLSSLSCAHVPSEVGSFINNVLEMRVCMCVCVCVCLRTRVSEKAVVRAAGTARSRAVCAAAARLLAPTPH